MNGEGDFFVNSEPLPQSSDWLWNIARDDLGMRTFWSLDNCPDKSARDYHAYPTVDSRVVAPICLAGVLLSHREQTCLGGKTVDEHVLDGLGDFWRRHRDERKFAAIQFITPHEETEKQLIEVDDLVAGWFENQTVFTDEELAKTAIVLWSDHGINFGKYASTHDGEIEKMFPFVFLILPRATTPKSVEKSLRAFANRLVTPYDMYATVRSLMHLPHAAPPIRHDPSNPPLPRAEDSHIMASFEGRKIVPLDLTIAGGGGGGVDRSCVDANIPVEFCSCLAWHRTSSVDASSVESRFFHAVVGELLVAEHTRLLSKFVDRCHEVRLRDISSVEVQVWPLEYRPPKKQSAKKMWMKPNRDYLKITYRTKAPGAGVFVGVVAIAQGLFAVAASKSNAKHGDGAGDVAAAVVHATEQLRAMTDVAHMKKAVLDVVRLDRMDAMTRKCGIVQKVPEQLCLCKAGEQA